MSYRADSAGPLLHQQGRPTTDSSVTEPWAVKVFAGPAGATAAVLAHVLTGMFWVGERA